MPSLADMFVSGVDEYSFALPFSAIPCNSLFSHEDRLYIKFSDEQGFADNLREITINSAGAHNAYCNVYSITSRRFDYFKPNTKCYLIHRVIFTQK